MNKINPLIKLITFLTVGALAFVSNSLTGLVLLAIPLLITFMFTKETKLKTFVSTLKLSTLLFGILLLIYMFTIDSGTWFFDIGSTPIYVESFQTAGRYAMRIWIILLAGSIFTKTTKDTEIANGFTYLLYPFKYIGVPVDRIGLTLAISIKFIPEFTYDAKQILLARKIRANNFNKWNLLNRSTLYLAMFTPLFVSVFRRASTTYNALYIAGYDLHNKKSKFNKFRLTWNDLLPILFMGGMIAIIILTNMEIIPQFADFNFWSNL